MEVRAVFLDISKAFDKVWHKGLVFKLKQNGISRKLLQLFENYLTNRRQRVVLDGFNSDLASIESGVPQGSILGSLLFLVYINDLQRNIKSNVNFFFYDTMLFSINKPLKNQQVTLIMFWRLSTNGPISGKWLSILTQNKQSTEILFSFP